MRSVSVAAAAETTIRRGEIPEGRSRGEIPGTARAFTGFSDFRKHYHLILRWPANTTRTMRGVNQNIGPMGGSYQGKLVNMRAVPGIPSGIPPGIPLGFLPWDSYHS